MAAERGSQCVGLILLLLSCPFFATLLAMLFSGTQQSEVVRKCRESKLCELPSNLLSSDEEEVNDKKVKMSTYKY